MQGVIALTPDGVAGLKDATLNRWVGAVTLLIVSGAAALCALAPIREARAVSPVETLAEGGRTATARRSLATRAMLQVVQTALAVMLLLSAGLVVRSFAALASLDLGFTPEGVLTMSVEPRVDTRPPERMESCRGLAPTGRTSALDQIPHRSERRPAAMLSRQSRFRSWLKPYFATTHVPRNANSATTTADGTVALSPETL